MAHPFGDLLRQYRARKAGLSQTRLAELAGYDQAILVRMSQGKKDLTGPSGRERVVRLIAVLHDEGALTSLVEANALLKAAAMPALFDGQPAEQALLRSLKADAVAQAIPAPMVQPTTNPSRAVCLPAQLSRFIGREQEMAEVIRLLQGNRLVTLTGSGGCGKTRLALEVATTLVGAMHRLGVVVDQGSAGGASPLPPKFADGVWLVEFAALSEGRLVADTAAAALGLQGVSRTSVQVLTDHLRDKRALLVLDNCEHLLQGCAELALALLQACPALHILGTSREPLNILGEVTWRVPPMQAEEGTQLFADRAHAAAPGFAVTPSNAEAITRICARLDNMPLALELAAARVRAFTVEQIDARLNDAFRLLTGGSRTALPRQQTLKATIDWSYSLLSDTERTLLQELSVFAGGWTLEAAGAVHGEGAAELLEQLVNKSLVVAEQKPTGMRYHLLETIRQYAAEKLKAAGEEVERRTRLRHLDYFAGLERATGPHTPTFRAERQAQRWASILEPEVNNLRVALDWVSRCEDWQTGQRLIACIASLWWEPGSATEICKWIDMLILSNPSVSDTARAAGLIMMGDMLNRCGDVPRAVDWYRKASTVAHKAGDEGLWLEADGMLGASTPNYVEAVTLLEQVIQHAHQAGRIYDELLGIQGLGERLALHGDYLEAIAMLNKGVALGHESGLHDIFMQHLMAHILWRLGQAYLEYGDYTRARTALEESIPLDHTPGAEAVLQRIDLGTAGLYLGDPTAAREVLGATFKHHLRTDNLERIAQGLVLAAGLAQTLGGLYQAARLLGAATAIRRDHHTHGVYEHELFTEYDRRLPAVRAAMESLEFDRAWAEGQRLTIHEAIAEALAIRIPCSAW